MQQKAKEIELSNQLESILLPYKQKQAALTLDKLQFDVELQTERLDREREAYRELRKRGFGSGGNDTGATSNPADGINYFQQAAPAPTADDEVVL